ncbi:unnamed protein product [Amoebophrya sp. A25]|nr:unnamed protein product [Amoebophrya sp. A25]|eukprot:GSA25T00001668001.1
MGLYIDCDPVVRRTTRRSALSWRIFYVRLISLLSWCWTFQKDKAVLAYGKDLVVDWGKGDLDPGVEDVTRVVPSTTTTTTSTSTENPSYAYVRGPYMHIRGKASVNISLSTSTSALNIYKASPFPVALEVQDITTRQDAVRQIVETAFPDVLLDHIWDACEKATAVVAAGAHLIEDVQDTLSVEGKVEEDSFRVVGNQTTNYTSSASAAGDPTSNKDNDTRNSTSGSAYLSYNGTLALSFSNLWLPAEPGPEEGVAKSIVALVNKTEGSANYSGTTGSSSTSSYVDSLAKTILGRVLVFLETGKVPPSTATQQTETVYGSHFTAPMSSASATGTVLQVDNGDVVQGASAFQQQEKLGSSSTTARRSQVVAISFSATEVTQHMLVKPARFLSPISAVEASRTANKAPAAQMTHAQNLDQVNRAWDEDDVNAYHKPREKALWLQCLLMCGFSLVALVFVVHYFLFSGEQAQLLKGGSKSFSVDSVAACFSTPTLSTDMSKNLVFSPPAAAIPYLGGGTEGVTQTGDGNQLDPIDRLRLESVKRTKLALQRGPLYQLRCEDEELAFGQLTALRKRLEPLIAS